MIIANTKINSGFAALMSTIIISATLLLIAVSLSNVSFYGRSNILDSELKERSFALAEGCVDAAILNLLQSVDYAGDVAIGSDKCTIQSVSGSNEKTITTYADYRNYITKLEVKVDSDMMSIHFEEK